MALYNHELIRQQRVKLTKNRIANHEEINFRVKLWEKNVCFCNKKLTKHWNKTITETEETKNGS